MRTQITALIVANLSYNNKLGVNMDHRSINLELRVDKSENVYRYIYSWRAVPSSHGNDIFYLLLHALVEWNGRAENIFCLAMQYSLHIGTNVDVSQPAHVLEQDIQQVSNAWAEFTDNRIGKR